MRTKSNPIDVFNKDWAKAKEEKDPNAPFCTLVTVESSSSGFVAPCARIVGLRQVSEEGGFLLFINSASPKWTQLQANSHYELLVFWPTQMIQYRLKGSQYSTMPKEEIQALWETKPHTSKLLDYYYAHHQPQSSELTVGGRDSFLNGMKQLKEQFPADGQSSVPFQEIATGLLLKPDSIEEWRGSAKDRLHERYRHDRNEDDSWQAIPLVP